MSVHFIARSEPKSGHEAAFREELYRVVEALRHEIGCVCMHVFETLHEPTLFAIHSEWVDEAAF